MLLILVAPNQLCGWVGREHGGSIPLAVFGSIQATCLPALVTDWAMETWYHPSIA
jgi:hypothetical protein